MSLGETKSEGRWDGVLLSLTGEAIQMLPTIQHGTMLPPPPEPMFGKLDIVFCERWRVMDSRHQFWATMICTIETIPGRNGHRPELRLFMVPS
jgi:hypothetical protein